MRKLTSIEREVLSSIPAEDFPEYANLVISNGEIIGIEE